MANLARPSIPCTKYTAESPGSEMPIGKRPDHVQVKAFSPIEMDKSSGLGFQTKNCERRFGSLGFGLRTNVKGWL